MKYEICAFNANGKFVIEQLSNLRAPAQIRNMYFHIYFSTDQYADCGDFLQQLLRACIVRHTVARLIRLVR